MALETLRADNHRVFCESLPKYVAFLLLLHGCDVMFVVTESSRLQT